MKKKVRIGIVGCGAIGTSLAKAIKKSFRRQTQLAGLYDIDRDKSERLSAFVSKGEKLDVASLRELINKSDLVIEAAHANSSWDIAKKTLGAGRDIMIMSVGGIVTHHRELQILAYRNNSHVFIPSGAISGVDALKAAHRTAALVKNPQGKPMNINLDTLVVPRGYANHHRAIEILGALRKGWQPATSDNEGPGIADYKIVATPWITTNTGYWWMFDSSMKNATYGLQYKESQAIQLEGPNVVFKTGEIQYKATMMFDIGFNDCTRGWVGSNNGNS